MSTASDFEKRRRERRRRERLRKKRIRAAIILIAFICIIVLICVGVSTCSNNNTENTPENDVSIETTMPPEIVPTFTPVASNIPSPSENNDLMDIVNNSVQSKRCYLTFDDGPTKNITPQILDVLRRYNVKATFFQVGSLIDANPDIARRVYEEGHLIANHSNGHNYEKLYASTDAFINEINECYEKIKTVTDGEEPFRLVRFPGGSFKSSADSYSDTKQECKKLLAEYGFYYCDWNALNGDAEGRKKDADELLEYLKDTMDLGENVVILMHDASAKQATADSLAKTIEYLRSQGYTFHRLDDIEYETVSTPAPTGSSEATDEPTDSDDDNSNDDTENSSTAPTKKPESSSDVSEDNEDSDNAKETAEPTQEAEETSRPTQVPESSGVIVIN
ncbi:MAG: polysaccharide deacetylase [Clostridia bacterium]|nr:polysaccharide deacetylase [Clostridia bacterium]